MFYRNLKKNTNTLLYSLLGILIIFSIFFERMPVENMLSFDGGGYVERTIHFKSLILNKEISEYHIQRIFPSFIIWLTATLFSITLSVNNVINAYIILNVIVIIISIIYFDKVCGLLKITGLLKSLGIILVFFNVAVLKMSFYYPVLNDTMAFAIGFGLLYHYLKNHIKYIIIYTLIGSFVFPTFLYLGLLLIMFQIGNDPVKNAKNYLTLKKTLVIRKHIIINCVKKKWGILLISISITTIYLLWELYTFVYKPHNIDKLNQSLNSPIQKYLFPLSLLICCLYILITIQLSLKDNSSVRNIFKSFRITRFSICIILVITITLINHFFASPSIVPFGIADYFFITIRHSITNPFKFVVSHFVYYGFLIAFASVYYRNILNFIANTDIGFKLVLIFFLLLSINPESRQLINFIPFLALVVLRTFPKYKLSYKIIIFTLIPNILLSRIWYPINANIPFTGSYIEFPWQRFFMLLGPWMSTKMFYFHASIFILSIALLFYILTKNKYTSTVNKSPIHSQP